MALKRLIILNPVAGAGRAGRAWRALAPLAYRLPGRTDVATTTAPGHAVALAAEAARRGYEQLVSVGGDGTLHEVANGLLGTGCHRDALPVLGMIPIGTGGDFARALGIPRDPEAALAVIAAGRARVVDAGVATLGSHHERRYFINDASWTVSAGVLIAARPWKRLGALAYFLASLKVMPMTRPVPVRLAIDDDPPRESRTALIALANGGWFGGGMHVAPGADLSDGLLDLVVFEHWGGGSFLTRGLAIYSGGHVRCRGVQRRKVRRVRIECAEPLPLELDGEPLGATPTEWETLPRALNVLMP